MLRASILLLGILLLCPTTHLPAGQQPFPELPGRPGADKAKLAEQADLAETERIVALGLSWLARQQRQDGSWPFEAGDAKDDKADATALALLPFLAAGETHNPGKTGKKYQKAVELGVKFLLKAQKADGTFGTTTTAGHARVTLLLVELLRATGDRDLLGKPAENALGALKKMRNKDGGWGADGKSDTVTTAWACFMANIPSGPPPRIGEKQPLSPQDYLVSVSDVAPKKPAKPDPNPDPVLETAIDVPSPTRFALRAGGKPEPGTLATAAGLAAWERVNDFFLVPDAPTGEGAKFLPPVPKEVDAEHLFFATIVCSDHVDGKSAAEWRTKVRNLLKAAQDKSDGAKRGSFPADNATAGKHGGQLATTAFAVLALEVPFKHLRAFRDQLEIDLTNIDPGIDANIVPALPEIPRIDPVTVDPLTTPGIAGLDFPEAPKLPWFPGIKLPVDPFGNVGGAGGVLGAGFGGREGAMAGTAFAGRTGATKTRLLRDLGGNADSELAVARGLAWLAKQQKADGSWVFETGDKGEVIAATGMVVLAFLGAGETHKAGSKYQKNVDAGLKFLVKSCPLAGANAGKFTGAGNMYTQAIGTLALCEAYGMTMDKALLLGPAQAAVNYIVKAQAANGSWGYATGTPGDTSIVGWQIQALHAAKATKDIVVFEKTIPSAIKFLDLAAAGSRKAKYGYNDNAGAAPGTSLTAVGLFCRQRIDGWDAKNAGLVEGVEGLLKRPAQPGKQPDMYYSHYAAQVIRDFGGEEWKTWNEGPKQGDNPRKGGLRDTLIELQIKKEGDNLGSWDPEGMWIGRSCGRLGTTALNILALEVYYRYLPPRVDVPKAPEEPLKKP